MTKGHIIFLNGASSSGKSTLAATLQKTLDESYIHMSIDGYLHQFEKILSGYQQIGQSMLPSSSKINHLIGNL